MKRWFTILYLLTLAGSSSAFDWDPFYESLSTTNGATFEAWRPFYSSSVDGERWRKDYLWPLYTRKGFKDETYGRFLFFGYSADFSPDTDRHRTWVLPIYFQGTSATGDGYFAIFPLGGTLDEFMGRDHIRFVLFPLYANSSINDVRTTSVLWPIGSKTKGEGIERFRIWPLYGRSVLEGEYEKKFILWPLYTSVRYTAERNPGGGFILIPLYGRVSTAKGNNVWLFPPFFRYSKGDGERSIYAFWPIFQIADGNVYKRYVWPLYGKKETEAVTRKFWLWPIVWDSTSHYTAYDEHRFRVVPVFQYETSTVTAGGADGDPAGSVTSRYWKVWPLMSWEREGDSSRFRTLELWPPYRTVSGIERNWAPIWTLYRRESSPGSVDHHLLWGLYRQSKGDDRREWSLLKGLAGYQRIGSTRSFNLLFMRFGEEE